MPIVYTISILILFTLVILQKKSEKKLEITKAIIITLVLTLAYNTFVCYILNLINIPITLLSLSVINIIISIILIANIIKTREIQKYKISKENIIVIILFTTIVSIITNINFGNVTKIRYVSMDAREHYKVAREFSENESLTNKATSNNTTAGAFMPGAYTNVGIIFKVLNPYIGTVNLYKAYIIFEAFVYLLAGIIFYILLEKESDKLHTKLITIIFSIIYIIGYPLNAWISGFHYLILGILFIETIIYIIQEKQKLNMGHKLITMFLLNLGLIFSYSLFCPFIYLAEFIYYIYKYMKEKDKIQIVLSTLITLILPGIIGVTYLIIPTLGKVGSFIALEGWLYKNLWSNFILFIPFTIYYIYKNIKNKNLTFNNVIFITLLIYMSLLYIGTKTGKCSEYYFYKNYYILWLITIYSSTKGMIKYIKGEKWKYIVYIYTIIYLVIFITCINYNQKYVSQEPDDSLNKTMEIFEFNKTMISAKGAAFVTNEELELLKEMENNIQGNWQKENNILLVTDPTQERWIQSLTGYINILYDDREYAIQNLKEENYKYIVTFENRNTYENIKQYIKKENMKIIYETEKRKNI